MDGTERPRVPLRQIEDWEVLILESGYSISKLAKLCGVSPRHLQRHMKTVFNKRLGSFITSVRLAQAHQRLLNGESVKEVAMNLGYKHISHFSRTFRKHYGFCASCLHFHRFANTERAEQLQFDIFNQPEAAKVAEIDPSEKFSKTTGEILENETGAKIAEESKP
jgi:AraC-like DNA-binding protein